MNTILKILFFPVLLGSFSCSDSNQNVKNRNGLATTVSSSNTNKENAIKKWLKDTDVDHSKYGEDDTKLLEDLKSEAYQVTGTETQKGGKIEKKCD